MSEMLAPHHLAATERFIDVNPSTIVIRRPVVGSDGVGGKTRNTVIVQPQGQKARLVGQNRLGQGVRGSQDGFATKEEMKLILMPGADVRKNDQFILGTVTYLINEVNTNPPWRVEAVVSDEL